MAPLRALVITAGLGFAHGFVKAPVGVTRWATKTTASCTRPLAVRAAATEARWRARPATALEAQMTEEEEATDQALIARVAAEVMRDQGVELDQLINPSKVINLERELARLRGDLAAGKYDSAAREEMETAVAAKERTLAVEKRAVMQGWLKNVFVGQAALSVVAAGLMVYDAVPFFPNLDLSVQVLGFWLIWLFTLPSLRARKPADTEKTALNYAFLATPLVSLSAPFITKDPVTIYWANLAVSAACYAVAYSGVGGDDTMDEDDANTPEWLKFVFKALDFGSGRERGARK